MDTIAAKRARDKPGAASNSGVSLIHNFFFNKKPAPAAAASPAPIATAPPRCVDVKSNGHSGVKPGASPPPLPPRPRLPNGDGSGLAGGVSGVVGGGNQEESSEDLQSLLEEAVPREFAGRSWEGFLHHVDFLVALMHVGTSLIPKNLIKVCEGRVYVGVFFGRGEGMGVVIACIAGPSCPVADGGVFVYSIFMCFVKHHLMSSD